MAGNPNPDLISGAVWGLWERLKAYDPGLKLGGVAARKPGYHNERDALPKSDYSVGQVAADRKGPGGKASAIDLTPATQTGMIMYTKRLDAAARAGDERLYIDGVPIIREFIGTKNGITVYCWVLTGGRGLGLPADSGVDFDRDNSHLWHVHISIIRQFCADAGAMDRLYSILAGESLAAWRARTGAGRPESLTVQEDENMSSTPIQFPNEFAYDETQNKIGPRAVLLVPVEPAGFAGNPVFGKKRLYVSLVAEHTEEGPVRVRVAIHNGDGWFVRIYSVPSGGRVECEVPLAKNGRAYSVSAGRMRINAQSGQPEADRPASLLVTVA